MPRQRNPNRDKAFKIYKDNKGNITNRAIANILCVPEKTISSWKIKDGWNSFRELSPKMQSTPNENTEYSNQKYSLKKDENTDKKLLESVEENNELTEKQKLFCIYYIDNFNATQSYLKAYKCSYMTAKVEGSKSLTKPNILKEIKKLKKMKTAQFLIDENDVLECYMHIAFADMNDFVDFGVNEMETINEQGVEEKYKRNYVNFKSSDVADGRLICEISVGKNGSTIKLQDRLKALEWLSKYFNMNPVDKHKIEYDKKRFELEQQKINGSESEIADEWIEAIIENDGE